MSRRSLRPRGPWWRRDRPGPDSAGSIVLLVFGVLARQTVLGMVLWGCRSTHILFDVPAGLAGLALVTVGARWAGMSKLRRWSLACREGIWLFIGGSCVANVLLIAFGAAPWFRAAPP